MKKLLNEWRRYLTEQETSRLRRERFERHMSLGQELRPGISSAEFTGKQLFGRGARDPNAKYVKTGNKFFINGKSATLKQAKQLAKRWPKYEPRTIGQSSGQRTSDERVKQAFAVIKKARQKPGIVTDDQWESTRMGAYHLNKRIEEYEQALQQAKTEKEHEALDQAGQDLGKDIKRFEQWATDVQDRSM